MHTSIFDSPILELRVLTGPQAGAALPLTGHDVVLGSDRGCDVILQSPCIAARHACFSVSEEGFSAAALDGEITVAEDAPSVQPWPFGTTIYLNEIGVTVERDEQAWGIPAPRAGKQEHPQVNTISALLAQPRRNWKRFTLLFLFLAVAAAGSQMVLGKHSATNAGGKLSSSNVHAIESVIARYRGEDVSEILCAGPRHKVNGSRL